MARYYCDYCHSYLTHDTLSVRKSHLVGKNHIRITADYYRNKARDQESGIFKRKKSQTKGVPEHKPIALHCMNNKEKKNAVTLCRLHKRELETQEEDVLQKLYEGSPGYSKVFIDSNRLDIGDMVRSNKLPQRANAATDSSHQQRSRNETILSTPRNTTPIDPPFILTQWSTTVPKTTIYNDNGLSLAHTIGASRKKILKRKRS